MTFSQQLCAWMDQISCTSAELSKVSGLSAATISRYRSGSRTPERDPETIRTLAKGLTELARNKGISTTEQEILGDLQGALSQNAIPPDFSKKLDALLSALPIRIRDISGSLHFDPSFLSRIRNGSRKPANPEAFAEQLTGYIVRNYNTDEYRPILAALLGCDTGTLEDASRMQTCLIQYLLSDTVQKDGSVDQFLNKLDVFDLNEYIRAIHFDALKVPSLPFQFSVDKIYYGLEEMKQGELDFFKATVLSHTNDPIFMCGDMPMEDMSQDREWSKKWMFAIAMSLRKGLNIQIVHNLERPFHELLLGLEAWIPMYMTGQLSPYYLPGKQNQVYSHLLYTSGYATLSGECISGHHDEGKYTLTRNKTELTYAQKRAARILEKANPLMEIYRQENHLGFSLYQKKSAADHGNRRNILSVPPIYTIPAELLDRLLARHQLTEDEKNSILAYREAAAKAFSDHLRQGTVTDEISLIGKGEFEAHPAALPLAELFFAKNITYTYEEYLSHLEACRQMAAEQSTYHCNISETHAFRNIQIMILENQYVHISKSNAPSIHFVIHHPTLVQAITNFIPPVTDSMG